MPADQVTYLDKSGAYHARRYPRLRRDGFRLVSLAVAGRLGAARYSAAWEPGPTEEQNAFWDRSRAEYRALYLRNVENGRYRVELLTVSGDGADAVFAGTFVVAEPQVEAYAKIDLRRGPASEDDTIQHWVKKARAEGLRPVSLSVYGTEDERQFAIAFVTNSDSTRWLVGYDDSTSRLNQRHRAAREISARPVHVSRSEFGRTASIYEEPKIGHWVKAFARSRAETDRFIESRDDYIPVTIAQGGTGNDARFSVVFARSKRIKRQQWRAPVGRSHPTLSIVDEKAEEFLTDNGVPAAAVAVGYRGRLLHAKAYRYAPDGVDRIRETTQFRIASLTKALTSIAAFRLVQAGRLNRAGRVQRRLHLRRPNGEHFEEETRRHLAQVTLNQLLWHMAGFRKRKSPGARSVASAYGAALPNTTRQIVEKTIEEDGFVFPPGEPPGNTWGTQYYSNLGYRMVGLLIEEVTGQSYEDAVRELVLRPAGIRYAFVGFGAAEKRGADEARYHPELKHFLLAPSDLEEGGSLRSVPYNGRLQQTAAAGGWVFSTIEYTRFLQALEGDREVLLRRRYKDLVFRTPTGINSTYGKGFGRFAVSNAEGWGHGGNLSSGYTSMALMDDGLSVVVFFNSHYVTAKRLRDKILRALRRIAKPDIDHFPAYGYSPFRD